MRYAKKRDDDGMDGQLDDDRACERLVRVRRREAPPRVTRKMAKLDAELLAMAATREESRSSRAPTRPPPRAVKVPPPLAIPFPFPFANSASTTMPSVAVMADDDALLVQDSWLLPSMMPPVSFIPNAGAYGTLVAREPDPFTVVPPAFSLPPRR